MHRRSRGLLVKPLLGSKHSSEATDRQGTGEVTVRLLLCRNIWYFENFNLFFRFFLQFFNVKKLIYFGNLMKVCFLFH